MWSFVRAAYVPSDAYRVFFREGASVCAWGGGTFLYLLLGAATCLNQSLKNEPMEPASGSDKWKEV